MPRQPAEIGDPAKLVEAVATAFAEFANAVAWLEPTKGKPMTRECLRNARTKVRAMMVVAGLSERDGLRVEKLFERIEKDLDKAGKSSHR